MPRFSKQAYIDQLSKRVAWYELVLKQMADWEFVQGGRDEQDWTRSAGRLARSYAQEALDGRSWKGGIPDFEEFDPRVHHTSHAE